MGKPSPFGLSHRPFYLHAFAVCALILIPAVSLVGDVPARLQDIPTASCYCRCHEAFTRRGCTKLCDAKKHAIHWLSTSCMKPRFQRPPDKSGTGPHLHHPDHAEHAQLTN